MIKGEKESALLYRPSKLYLRVENGQSNYHSLVHSARVKNMLATPIQILFICSKPGLTNLL